MTSPSRKFLDALVFQLSICAGCSFVSADKKHSSKKGRITNYAFRIEKGARIVRLHRLWEVYLVNSLGLKVERVHKSAEEMEHILTPELERKLTELLDNPKQDPHDQPIPYIQ